MLEIIVPAVEKFDEETLTFVYSDECKLSLEHSLISISKWESKWKKPFISSQKTMEEKLDYIRCMTLNKNVPSDVYFNLTAENLKDIEQYIDDPMTATVITNAKGHPKKKEIVTAEIIYYWMIALNIPTDYQKWHINRLLTLIDVCAIKTQPQKKMSRNEIINQNRELNAARKKKYNTRG